MYITTNGIENADDKFSLDSYFYPWELFAPSKTLHDSENFFYLKGAVTSHLVSKGENFPLSLST